MIDALAALRLQLEWGADEALGETPVYRFAPAARVSKPEHSPATKPAPQAATLEALYAELDAFSLHPLRASATHTVRWDGRETAPLLLIGDAPGSEDDRSGRAFGGPPGALIDRVFASIGLDRETMLLTTVVPWRPPGGRPLTEAELQTCLPFLWRLLAIVRPKHLVMVGNATIRALTNESGTIRRLRGRWLQVQIPGEQILIPALALPSINQWLRDGSARQQLWSDLILIGRAVTKG